MTCPRCKADVKGRPDAAGIIVCPACSAQLKVKASGSQPPTPVGNFTLPPGARAPVPGPGRTPPPPVAAAPARAETPTRPLGPVPKAARGAAAAPAVPAPLPAAAAPAGPASLEDVLSELKAVRGLQVEILSMLKAMASVTGPAAAPSGEGEDPYPPATPTVRTRRRKSVLVIDDDEETRKAAVAAFEQAEVPVTTAKDGTAGLEAMASGERPDVVVLELGLAGRMAGKDVVNMIKATMEWVDIPIVLYTRLPVDGQKEARLVHGADELVPKGPGAPEALVARVIALFRRG